MNVRRPVALAAAAGLAVLALAGCSNQAGVASQVGSTTITDRQVADAVDQVQQENAAIPGSTFDQQATTANIVAFLTQAAVIEQAAAKEGITITQGDVDRQISEWQSTTGGTRKSLDSAVLSQVGLPSDLVDAYARYNVLRTQLLAKIAPGVTDATQQGQRLTEYFTKFDAEIGVDVSPRFGSWNGVAVGPVPDDLSSPTPTPSPSSSGEQSPSGAASPSPSAS